MIINRIYETQNLLSLWFASFLAGLRTYQYIYIYGLVTKIVLHYSTHLDNLGSNSGAAEHSNPVWRYTVSVSYQRTLHWSNLSLWLVYQINCAHIGTSYRAVFTVDVLISFLKMQKTCFCITMCGPTQTYVIRISVPPNKSLYVWPYSKFCYQYVCYPIQTSVITMCVTLFRLLLSPYVLPYSDFCYHHVCYPIQTCYHHVCYPIQTSVITMCVTLFKLLLSPCVLSYWNFCYHHVCYPIKTSVITMCVVLFRLLLSPCVLPYSNFCYHHVCYHIQTSVITIYYPIQTSIIAMRVTPFKLLLSPCVTLFTFHYHHMSYPIQTSVNTMCYPIQIPLSSCVLPYSNFCYHHACYPIQTSVIAMCYPIQIPLSPCVLPHSDFFYHHVCGPIQTSVITTCVTLFKLLLSPRMLSYSTFNQATFFSHLRGDKLSVILPFKGKG